MTTSQVIAQALLPFKPLFDAFNDAGFQLYAVGGCVRDWIIGTHPKDVDFTTDALPDQTRDILTSHGWKVIPVGEVFGTIATLIHKKQYEITTFRVRESYTRGSRHPIVCYGKSLAADLERRDLTINAMAASFDGQIIDPFDGLGDLERHILRVPRSSYEQSMSIFGDDPLRMLRLARFMARLSFNADPDATRAATDMAGSILSVSHERWFAEIDGLLRANNPVLGIQWLLNTGIFQLIFPEFSALHLIHRQNTSLSDGTLIDTDVSILNQILSALSNTTADGDFRWYILLYMIGYAASTHADWAASTTQMIAAEILDRLKFSAARKSSLLRTISLLPAGLPSYRNARELAIFLADDMDNWNRFQDIRLLAIPEPYRTSERERLTEWRTALQPYFDNPASAEVQLPKALSGALSQALNVRGKTLGLCIAQCRDAILDKCLSENDDCDKFVDWVREHFDNSSPQS